MLAAHTMYKSFSFLLNVKAEVLLVQSVQLVCGLDEQVGILLFFLLFFTVAFPAPSLSPSQLDPRREIEGEVLVDVSEQRTENSLRVCLWLQSLSTGSCINE